jgi:gluconate 2-dehydrogenase gamma chain
MSNDPDDLTLSRRTLINSVVASAAFVPLAALTASAQTKAPTALNAGERKILDAFVDRLIPADELGPGALQAGAAEYIDRALAGYIAAERGAIGEGLAAVDTFAKASQGAAFADLSPEKRDAVITALEAGQGFPAGRNFFNRVRRLTLEGMFSDPHWGGNQNFVGWDLIRYPGPRPAVGPEEQKMGVDIKPYRKSAWGTEHGH